MTPPTPKPLVIGIDARAAAEVPAGRGRFVRELLRALAAEGEEHRYLLYARERWDAGEGTVEHEGGGAAGSALEDGESGAAAGLDRRFSWRLLSAPDPLWHLRAAVRASRECDVFLSSNSYLTVWFLRVPAVPVVYDMITFEPTMRPNRRSTLIERATLGLAVRRAAGIIAISSATARALAERFPAAASKTTVAPLGVASGLLDSQDEGGGGAAAGDAAADSLAPGFVLAVGTLEPRKNLPRMVEAYRRLPEAVQAEHPLAVVGAKGWETGETLQALRSLGDRAVQLGYVSDRALADLYRRCAVFCYPSLGEGFGLPVLEAMAAGAAVLTSNISSLPEVGGDAVEYVEPTDVASIAAALERLLRSPERRAELGSAASARARLFSWEQTAKTVLGVLSRAAR